MLVVGALVVVVALGLGALELVAAVTATHRARTAADLAALAAAATLADTGSGAEACGRAARLSRADGAELVDCGPDATTGAVRLTVEVALPGLLARAGVGPARASARAGPVPAR